MSGTEAGIDVMQYCMAVRASSERFSVVEIA